MSRAALPSIPTRLGAALVTADDVAEFLQIDRASVYRLAGREIPVVEIGRTKRFRVADVLAFVGRQTRQRPTRSGRGERLLQTMQTHPTGCTRQAGRP